MKKELLTHEREGYESPSAEVLSLEPERIICESNGDTEDYEHKSIW